jgi:exosortase/archaeosortase family protein
MSPEAVLVLVDLGLFFFMTRTFNKANRASFIMVRGSSKMKMGVDSLAMESLAFLARWILWFALGWAVFSPFEPFLQGVEAAHVRIMLDGVGVETVSGGVAHQFFMNGKLIEISPLCSGLLEMILLASAILATRNEKRDSRVRGVIGGVLLLYLFNLIRMVITLLQLEHASLSFAVLTHDYLFRLLLILGFVFVYGGWLNRARIRGWMHQRGWL